MLAGEAEVGYSFVVEEDTVILDLAEEGKPVSIQFANTKWYRVNLYNRMGIPAIPFVVTL